MMKLAIMQPYFFPYIGYFQVISAVDKYILYDNLDFITEGWMQRNRILVKNQKPIYINANVVGKSSNKKIKDIELVPGFHWKKKLINSIYLNYRGSEYFDEVFQLLEDSIKHESQYLHEYNSFIISEICNFLDVKTQIVSKNENYLILEDDLNQIELQDFLKYPVLSKTKPIKKVARVILMCKQENADVFINPIGGVELYNKEEFKQYDVNLFFLKANNISYPQFSNEFFPNLSIIDVLMHNGKNKTMSFLNDYTLV